jgi:hypothetical protein
MMMRALGSRATPADLGVEGSEKELRRKQALERARVCAAGARSNSAANEGQLARARRPKKGGSPPADRRGVPGSRS